MISTWRTARRHCNPGCFAYHATWPLVRAAGIKASPRWHHGFYRHQLDTAGLLTSTEPVRVLVAATADHTLPAVLAELIDPRRLDLTVIDRCPTPLTAVRRWAHNTALAGITTTLAAIPDCPPLDPPADLAVTDGLLSLLPDQRARLAALAWLATSLRPAGLLLYTTRLSHNTAPLEYDRTGRALQTAATALGWRRPGRWELTRATWQRPVRSAPYRNTAELHDDLASHFGSIYLTTDTTAPTRPLLVHPRRWRGHESLIVRVAAHHPAKAIP